MDDKSVETVMEAVCDICHLPYVTSDQDALDVLCASCPVEKRIREVCVDG